MSWIVKYKVNYGTIKAALHDEYNYYTFDQIKAMVEPGIRAQGGYIISIYGE